MNKDLKITYIRIDDLVPNPWNPNVMDDEMYRRLVESIREFGFVDPVTARKVGRSWQIIDAEHRVRGAKELGYETVPAVVIEADDTEAEQLTIVLNELRGKPNEEKLAALVRDLSTRRSTLDLERVLPFRRQQLAAMLAERKASIDWDAVEKKHIETEKAKAERWIEKIFRMPKSAADVLDEALGRMREDGVTDDWKALELICADYLSGV